MKKLFKDIWHVIKVIFVIVLLLILAFLCHPDEGMKNYRYNGVEDVYD